MHVTRLRALIVGAVFILPLAASGAPPTPAPTTLHALVEQAWLRSPTGRGIAARQGEIDAALGLAGSWIAGQPELGLSQRGGRWSDQSGVRESEVSLSAPFWRPGQRTARRHLADQSATELQAQIRKVRLDIAGAVRVQLWDAAAAHALLEEKIAHLQHTEELADEVKRRVSAGDLARVDALLADQEIHAVRLSIEHAKAEAQASLSKLRILTGPGTALPAEPEPLAAAANPENPRLQAARATENRARAALRLAQSSRSAPPTVSLSMRDQRDRPLGSPERSLGLSLQVPIGTAGRNRPVEAEVQTQIAVAAAEAEQAAEVIEADLELAKRQLDHARAALAAAGARVSVMREHQQLIEKAFRLGERGLADLLRSRALAHEAQLSQRQQQVALGRAHAQYNQASGVLP